jgi:hypothetical protein
LVTRRKLLHQTPRPDDLTRLPKHDLSIKLVNNKNAHCCNLQWSSALAAQRETKFAADSLDFGTSAAVILRQ